MPNFFRHRTLAFDIVTWQWDSDKTSEPRGQKRSQIDSTESSSTDPDVERDDVEDGLKIWGYMPGHVHYNLGRANGEVTTIHHQKLSKADSIQQSLKKETSDESDKLDAVESVLHAIPPRSITGMTKHPSPDTSLSPYRRHCEPFSIRGELPIQCNIRSNIYRPVCAMVVRPRWRPITFTRVHLPAAQSTFVLCTVP